MKWRTSLLLCLFLAITGCGEMVRKQPVTPDPPPAKAPTPVIIEQLPPEPPKVITVVKKVDVPVPEKKDLTCKLLPAPKHLPLPVAPNTRRGEVLTDHQRILLFQDYIRSLQAYIKNQNDTEDKAYQDYIQGCANPVTQPAPATSVAPAPSSSG
jgi:hypothetical protein